MANYVRRVAWVELASGQSEWEYIEPTAYDQDFEGDEGEACPVFSPSLGLEGQAFYSQ